MTVFADESPAHTLSGARSQWRSAFWSASDYAGRNEQVAWYEDIRSFAKAHSAGALIRLGWGCGMNAVGLNLARPLGKHPPGRKDPQFYYDAKTRVLINGIPPGWALFTLEEE